MNKRVLITGATAGIGEAAAYRLASAGFDLILTGRRAERLENLSKAITEKYAVDVVCLPFDISKCAEVEAAINSLPESVQIDVLVNNAGLGLGYERFDESKVENWDAMIDTNIKGVLYISRIVSQRMVKRMSGLIINIGSIAGVQRTPSGVVYGATKAALHSMTLSMRVDLLPFNIRVCELRPGVTRSEFVDVRSHGDLSRKDAVYGGLNPLE